MKPEPSILFVCTGNICRSPMAEYLFRERLVGRQEWAVASAGTSAIDGLPASAQAVTALVERGIDLSPHRSRALRSTMVDRAYIVLAMTDGHRDDILSSMPRAADKLYRLLDFAPAGTGRDVPDPIGSPVEVYQTTRDLIEEAFDGLIRFLEAGFRQT